MLLAQDTFKRIAWNVAEQKGNITVLQKLLEWGKETLTAEELNNKLLLDKGNEGQTAFHFATRKGKVEALQTL
jgi:ankyrin repeat protein